MKRIWRADILIRLLVPLVLIPILGLSARSHEADGALQRARLAMNAQEPAAAAVSLSKTAEHLPSRPELWEIAGQQALAGGETLTAIEHFQKAAERGSLSSDGYTALGKCLQLTGDIQAAMAAWSEGLEHYGENAEMLALRARAFRELGEFPGAITDLRTLTSLEPGNADARYQLGLLLAATQPEAASAHLVQVADFDESFIERVQTMQDAIRRALFAEERAYTYVSIGQTLASLGEWDLAAEAFKNATLLDGNYAEAWAYLGEARGQLGEDGLSELQNALALNPDSLAGNVFMGLHWRREGQHELALVYLHAAADLDPENPATQADIGRTLLELGDLNKALEYYQRATELAERDPTYWKLLAEFSIFNEVYVEEVGLPAARQATVLDADDPAALALIGQAYFLLEDNLTAERFLMRAIEADPNYAPAHLYLGIYYLSSGGREDARLHLTSAAELDPNSPAGEQAQRLLENYFPQP